MFHVLEVEIGILVIKYMHDAYIAHYLIVCIIVARRCRCADSICLKPCVCGKNLPLDIFQNLSCIQDNSIDEENGN